MASPPPPFRKVSEIPDYATHVLLSRLAVPDEISVTLPFVRHGDVTKKFEEMSVLIIVAARSSM